MTEKSVIRQRLWSSLEMRIIRWELILLFAVSVLLVLIEYKGASGELIAIVTGVVSAPNLWRILRIFRKVDGYAFHQTTLSQFHRDFPSKSIYFTVELEAPDGSKITKNTYPIFARRGMMGTLAEDYVNREMTIAYNEDTETVVVIG